MHADGLRALLQEQPRGGLHDRGTFGFATRPPATWVWTRWRGLFCGGHRQRVIGNDDDRYADDMVNWHSASFGLK